MIDEIMNLEHFFLNLKNNLNRRVDLLGRDDTCVAISDTENIRFRIARYSSHRL